MRGPETEPEDLPEDEQEEQEQEIERLTRAAVLAVLGLVAVLGIMVATIEPLREALLDAVSGDTEALREGLRDSGVAGVAVVMILALIHSVVFYPAEILDAAAGFVYGFWPAMVLLMVGWIINGVICYQIGAHAARPVLMRMLGVERFTRYEGLVSRGGATLLLAMRLIPIVPFSAFSYVAGSARVPLWTFIWTTTVGYIPITALFIYLGSRLEELSPTDPVIWAGAIGLILMVLLSRRIMVHLARKQERDTAPPS